ncbi:MAG TPA: protein kinase [Blastocatellia bacterium]|nr:protein kinase [Blastocatellia bacterium]
MYPELRKQAEQIAEAALRRAPEERAAFLAQACADNQMLRDEVEALMAARCRAENHPDGRDRQTVAASRDEVPAAAEEAPFLTGRQIGPYRVEREIGRGGMGAVYLAVRADQEFQRRVAIKVIKRGMDTEFILRRFRRERQILAALDHHNIAALLDGGSTEDGLPYFIMEYIEGQPIHRYCDQQRLTVAERLRLIEQVCAAVALAHQKQIVHRDLKPGNILVTHDGTAKLLDFGIAKLLDPELAAETIDPTATAMRLMTPEYASPEQVRGLPVTPASDVYSLGVMLYELLTGHRPYQLTSRAPHELARIICEEEPVRPSVVISRPEQFVHPSGAVITLTPETICQERRTTVEALRAELAGNLDQIILRALRKDPQRRYANAADLGADIARHLSGQAIQAEAREFTAPTTRLMTGQEVSAGPSIAVLPLKVVQAVRGGDTGDQYLGVGMADALMTQLGNMRGLMVRPTSAVLKYAGDGADPLEAGRELKVDYLLDGRIQLAGERMRVTVQLISLSDQAILWAAQFDEKNSDLLAVQDAIAAQVAEALAIRLTGEERARLARRGTDNPRAWEAWLRGRYHWHTYTVEGLARALVHFNEAISIDPSFAAPYAGIAEYYNRLATFGVVSSRECFTAAKEAAHRAVLLDETMAEAWAALAFATLGADWNHAESERLIRRALELNPNSVQAHEWHSLILAAAQRRDEAVAAIERAIALDPYSSALHGLSAFPLHLAGRQADSLRAAQHALRLDPNSFWAVFATTMQSARLRLYDTAIASARKLVTTSSEHPLALAALAFALAAAGEREEARQTLGRMMEKVRGGYISPYFPALVCTELGDFDEALGWIERGLRERDCWMLFFNSEPWFDPLRANPRLEEMRRTSGLPVGNSQNTPSHPLKAPETARLSEVSAEPVRPGRFRLLAATLALIAVAVAGFAVYRISSGRAPATRFLMTTSSKLTTTGNAVIAALSPDGRQLAWVSEEAGRQSLWLRQTAISNSIRLVAPAELTYRGLTFSRDGSFIYYVAAERNGHGMLYAVPLPGGTTRIVAGDVDSPIGLSPDGKEFAFVRNHSEQGEDDLIVTALDGTREREVATRKFPEHFSINSAPAWSPDGKQIACVVETSDQLGFFMKAVALSVSDGAEKLLTTQRWMVIDQMVWQPEGGWLMSAQDAGSPFMQIWSLAASGQARKLTSDLADHKGLSLPSDFSAMVTVERQILTNIRIGPMNALDNLRQITTGAGRYFDLAWTPDGRVLYAADTPDSADIWEKQITGTEQRQLTAGVGRNYGPTASPDGRYVIFHSNRSGNWQLWRMNRDGSEQTQLTSGHEESNWAHVSPDNREIVFERIGAGSLITLWKMPVDGGPAQRLTGGLSRRPAISPDGRLIACWRKDETPGAPWRIALIPIEGGEPVKFFEVKPNDASGGSVLRWTPDGRSLVYIDYSNGITSLWLQPLAGGPPRRLLTSTTEIIFSFDIDRNSQFAISHSLRANDVKLISDAGQSRP